MTTVMAGASSIWAEMVLLLRFVRLLMSRLLSRNTSSFRPYSPTRPRPSVLTARPRFSARRREVLARKAWNTMILTAKRI